MTSTELDTLVARGRRLQQQGRLQEAHDAYRRVLAADPEHAEASHGLGLLLHQGAGRHAEGADLIARAVVRQPGNAVYRSNLGVVLKDAGRLDEAVASYQAALRIDPGLAQTRSNLGVALLALGRVDEAIAAQRQAIASRADYPEAQVNLGLALAQAGDAEAAVAGYQAAIALRADYAAAYRHLATALVTTGRLDEAEVAARRAVALRPGEAGAHYALGLVLNAGGRLEEAAASYQAALEIAPEAAAYRNLGLALNGLGDFRGAAAVFREAIALDDSDAAAHGGLADALSEMGGKPRAVASYRRALALNPDNDAYRGGLAAALIAVGQVAEAEEIFRSLAAKYPDSRAPRLSLIFTANYAEDLPADELPRRAADYGRALAGLAPARARHANDPNPAKRLKVGLVSGDFRLHPVASFLESALRAIDPSAVEFFAYSTTTKHDEMTERLRSSISNWHDAARLDDDALDSMIVADGIDVLIDLAAFTRGGRLPVFARKPAPVQATWLGYSGTTGLPAMDYVLADAVVAPRAEERLFSERVWRLPDAYLCYTPPTDAPEVAPLPALQNGHVTFGSFNNLNKVNDATIALWARVLRAVPTARLALKSTILRRADAGAEILARFAKAGVVAERLVLLGYEAEESRHLAAYGQVDIGLDPFPYNGTTTTCEAMLMGVPVLTLKGDRFIAHVGESLLRTVGLDAWVAADADDFVAKAATFAADLPALAALRAGLRPRMLASPLCDAPRFARNFEAALRGMWTGWCAGQGRAAQQ